MMSLKSNMKIVTRKGSADENLDLERVRRQSVYSYEERMKAVELYIKYDRSATGIAK